tara:strand:- start:55 stop:1362 length:1308 start_codon:yes stop_codon:yes gene_type:complete
MALPNITLEAALDEAEKSYITSNPVSNTKWRSACKALPGGNTRSVLFFDPFPVVMARAEGARLWDLDGHRYTDFLGDFTAGLYGHSNPVIQDAVRNALNDGVSLGASNIYEEQLAHAVCERFPSLDLVRFTNSGTEANLMAVLAARAITGRDKVLAFERGYHGGVFVFKKGNSPINLPIDWVMAKYNQVEDTLAVIDENSTELAAILVEPMMGAGGCIPADGAFIESLRERANRYGIILIFDEVMTSRLAPGGLQEVFGVNPDMTTLGKYIGGGMTIGAFGGRRSIMEEFDLRKDGALFHSGTYNNNVLSMAAGTAGLTKVYTPRAANELNSRGDHLRKHLNALAADSPVPMQVTGQGSMMNVHFSTTSVMRPEDVDDCDENALKLFHLDMLARGKYLPRRGFMSLSLPITDEDIEEFVADVEDFLETRASVLGI